MSDHDLAINQLAAEGIPDRTQELAQLFPEAMTDGKVDVEKLRLLIGEKVEESQERYGLTWPGKRDAIRLAQKQSTATLEPMPDESVDWHTTKNLIIEGDNLEVLKLLQKSYYGQVKLIYIDPPYNTGKDFVYPDNFAEPTESYLARSGQSDGNGFRTSTNRDTSGRFHSDWLDMMYSRLTLARNLLQVDGMVFVSIDDNEMSRLRLLMDEVFGEDNLIAELVWSQGSGAQAGHFTGAHEYVLVYAKDKPSLDNFKDPAGGVIAHGALKKISQSNPSSEVIFPAGSIHIDGPDREFTGTIGESEKTTVVRGRFKFVGGNLVEEVVLSAGWAMKNQLLSWLEGKETFDSKGQRVVRFFFNSQGVLWYEKERGFRHPKSVLDSKLFGSTSNGRSDATALLGDGVFSFPKPVALVQFFVGLVSSDKEELVLDFFAGSGTTGHAVMAQNAEDCGNRKFILVQLPEATGNSEFPKISDITRERVRRAGKKIKVEAGLTGDDLDFGFRSFKLSGSNFKNWDADAETLLAEDLEAFVNNINTNASDDGIVHEILLKAGIRLDTDLASVQVAGQDVTLAAEGLIAVSANRSITQEFIDGLLALEPQVQQVYLLDSGFGDNDSLKVNARHQFAARRSDSNPDKDDALRTV